MFKKLIVLLGLAFIHDNGLAQFSVAGKITDQTNGTALSGATVVLQNQRNSVFETRRTDSVGQFIFQGLPPDSFQLVISYVGYKEFSRGLRIDPAAIDRDTSGVGVLDVSIALAPANSQDLSTVVISTRIPMARQKGDTLEINASQFKVNPDASAEDLARKVPGITIENGQVKAQGENVQKVTIDGRELFGDDATAALRNLPAEIVDKIQIFDRLSDQAQFTGFDDGSATKSINIVTKANMRNGQFGRVYAGYGTDERYQAGGNATILKDNRRISLVGNFNNVNQQNFSQQDLLGLTSSTQRGRGDRGGRGGGNQGNSGNFSVGQQNGINRTNAFGINYSDSWGSKLTATGSYFFNDQKNTTQELSNQQYFLNSVPNLSQSNTSTGANTNHRLNLRVEWKLDSSNQIIFSPNISLQKNTTDRVATTHSILKSGLPISTTANNTLSNRWATNLNGNILWRHSFAKRGRTFSVNLNSSSNTRTGEVYVDGLQRQFDSSGNTFDSLTNRFTDQVSGSYDISANIAYTEPAGEKGQIQVNYNPSFSNSNADQEAFQMDAFQQKYTLFDTAFSNRFDNITKTHNAGLSYRYGDRDNMFSIGANFQHNNLQSDQQFPTKLFVNKTFSNILPNAMVRLKLSSRSNIRLFYRSRTNNPSVNQLSDVFDITNLPFITAGNPELKQQVTNFVGGRYTYTNPAKSILFVGNVFYQAAQDYITNATFVAVRGDSMINNRVTLLRGQQLSIPVNLDGYRNLRSFITVAFPLGFIKSNFNLNGGVSFSKLPGIINSVTSLSKNKTYSAGAVIASNVSQYVDFTVSYNANFSAVENELQAQLNDEYFQHSTGVQLNLLSKKGWFFQNDLSNQRYNGLTQGFNQNYTLWNMSVGKKFLEGQKGELKLSVFDLLKQNQSINRNVTENFIEDTQNQVLQQYFLITFTYNLRNFGTGVSRPSRDGERRMGPPRF